MRDVETRGFEEQSTTISIEDADKLLNELGKAKVVLRANGKIEIKGVELNQKNIDEFNYLIALYKDLKNHYDLAEVAKATFMLGMVYYNMAELGFSTATEEREAPLNLQSAGTTTSQPEKIIETEQECTSGPCCENGKLKSNENICNEVMVTERCNIAKTAIIRTVRKQYCDGEKANCAGEFEQFDTPEPCTGGKCVEVEGAPPKPECIKYA